MKKLLYMLCFSAAALGAAEYFVSPAGKDSNPGTASSPFATIGKAVETVQPGDIVTVRSGVYHEVIAISKKATAKKPIIIRGAAGETAVITGGYDVTTPWKKTAGFRFIWETPVKYSVNMLWDKLNLNRFLELKSLAMVEKCPGSFTLDKKTKKLYVHPLQSVHPEAVGIVLVPWFDKKERPLPLGGKTGYRWTKGVHITGNHITLDNFYVTFFPGQGIRVTKPGKYNTVSNCTVLGTTCGIMDYSASFSKIIKNRLLRNAGTGIQLTGAGAGTVVEDNFMFNNGSCYQSGLLGTGSSGQIYNFAHYGNGYNGLDLRRNIMIAFERRNASQNTMRCKGGVRRYTNQTHNVFVNGGVELYARSNSSGDISSNTMIDGRYNIHKQLRTGEFYKVKFENNLIIGNDEADPLFADESYFDYRLRKHSPHAGKGAYPVAGKGFCHVKNTAALNAALARKDIDTIYLEKGTYTGKITTCGYPIVLRNAGKEEVVIQGTVTGKGAEFEGLIFKNAAVRISGKAVFDTCVLDRTCGEAAELVIRKTTLVSTVLSGKKALLRDTLLAGKANKITAGEKLEENTGTIDQLDASYRLPQNHRLAYAAFDCGAIGGRPAAALVKEFVVEDLEVTPIPPDRARVTAQTPNHYWGKAFVQGAGFRGGATQESQGLKLTNIEIIVRNLKPGKSYSGEFKVTKALDPKTFYSKKITIKMPSKAVRKPVTHTVNAGNPLDKVLKKLLPGDTILLEPGVYDGGFRICVDNVTIKSKVPGKAMLSSAWLYGDILVLDRVKNVTVDGIRFGNVTYSASRHSLSIRDSRNIVVRNCYFDRARPGYCSNIQLHAGGIDNILIQDCVFNSGFQGIWLLRAKNVTIDHNTFWGIGINSAHIGCEQGDKVVFTNNISMDVVGGHHSPAFSVAEHGKHITSDYNLYWSAKCKKQEIYGFGRYKKTHYFSGTWDVMNKNMEKDIRKVRSRFGLEKHGLFADPLFEDFETFRLKKNSPARGAASDGSDLGARKVCL